MERDYYSLLGVGRFASQETLRRAFRSTILQIHPDRNPADIEAAEHARQVIQAYGVLRDPHSRRRYDNTLTAPITPVYAAMPYYRYENRCPQWLTRCFVLLLFFAMSAGVFCIVAQSLGNNTPVFRPDMTSFQATPPPAVWDKGTARRDQGDGWSLRYLQEAHSSDPTR